MTGKGAEECKPKLDDVEANIFVEAVENNFDASLEIPGAVDEEKAAKKVKLRNRVVAGRRRSHPLFAGYADANIRRLYHGDIVGAIANREHNMIAGSRLLDELDDLRLLRRRHTAADDGAT